MGAWFVSKVLPGLTVSAIWMPAWTAVVWASHRRLRRHITKVADQQTAKLSGRNPKPPGGAM